MARVSRAGAGGYSSSSVYSTFLSYQNAFGRVAEIMRTNLVRGLAKWTILCELLLSHLQVVPDSTEQKQESTRIWLDNTGDNRLDSEKDEPDKPLGLRGPK